MRRVRFTGGRTLHVLTITTRELLPFNESNYRCDCTKSQVISEIHYWRKPLLHMAFAALRKHAKSIKNPLHPLIYKVFNKKVRIASEICLFSRSNFARFAALFCIVGEPLWALPKARIMKFKCEFGFNRVSVLWQKAIARARSPSWGARVANWSDERCMI
jgi:hypothetical protein